MSPEHHVGCGRVLAMLGRFEEAIENSRAISLAPNHAFAHVLRGIHRTHLDPTEDEMPSVLADFTRAVELAPDRLDYRHQLTATRSP
jgi:hypothetical protein